MLAFQHYQTFSERLKDFPCRIEYISRARTAKEIRETLKDLKEGKINIIIGTHRIVGKDVTFKDLGLLIIDEEQKFGVSVKEKLRQLKANVDTLTMTATPIPRTLQFSLMGARDLSSITTPPPNRYPVQTEVERFNPDIIREAINFEMSRNGQVFSSTTASRIFMKWRRLSNAKCQMPVSPSATDRWSRTSWKNHSGFRQLRIRRTDRYEHCREWYRRAECKYDHHQ